MAVLFLATSVYAQVREEYEETETEYEELEETVEDTLEEFEDDVDEFDDAVEDTFEVIEDTLYNDDYYHDGNGNGENGNGQNGDRRVIRRTQREYEMDRFSMRDDEPTYMPWVGFGVHGGPITSLSNDDVEESIRTAYEDISDFDLESDMTNLGVHFAMNSMKLIGFIAAFDYSWRDQNIAGNVDLTSSIASLTGDVNVIIPFVLSPFVGAGIGGYRTATSIDADTIAVILPDDETNFGWNVRGGLALDVPRFPLRPFAEWKYHRIEADNPVTYHAINFGLTFKFR